MVLLQNQEPDKIFHKKKKGENQTGSVQRQQVNKKFSATGKRKGAINQFSIYQIA
jgi:hypothetical protein